MCVVHALDYHHDNLHGTEEEELVGGLVEVVVGGIATLELPSTLSLEGIKEGKYHGGLANLLISEGGTELAEPVGRGVLVLEGKLGLVGSDGGADGGEDGVELLDGVLADGAHNGHVGGVNGEVNNQVLIGHGC